MAEELAAKTIREASFRVYLPRYRKILRGVHLAEDGRRIRTSGAGEGAKVKTVGGQVAEIARADERGKVQLLQKWFGADRLVDVADPMALELAAG